MRAELLVDAPEFWDRLREDLGSARRSAYIQTFTFEGDRVGVALARALRCSPAADRRLLIDRYSLLYHSDRLILGPAWRRRDFRREVMLTRRWVQRLRAQGVGVQFGNPLGPRPTDVVRRNHKKIAVFDERVAYVGGINFSDHNFEWHDMMFRIECDDLGALLTHDFFASWDGRPRGLDTSVGPLRVLSLNGRANAERMRPILEAVSDARRSIDVHSAYLSHPFTEHLVRAGSRGVRVRLITPTRNNKPNLTRHVIETAQRGGFEVLGFAGGMSHLKAMLIDDETLVTGSSNFDFMSYHILEELVVMTRDRGMIDAFLDRVWTPDAAAAIPVPVPSRLSTRLGHLTVRTGEVLARGCART